MQGAGEINTSEFFENSEVLIGVKTSQGCGGEYTAETCEVYYAPSDPRLSFELTLRQAPMPVGCSSAALPGLRQPGI